MPTPRLLANAPIREAVVEVRVSPFEAELTLPALHDMADSLEGYPTVQPLFQFQGQFKVDQAGEVETNQETSPVGFRAISEDETHVIQFRLNGISISRLQPYVSWEQLYEVSGAHWTAFRESFEVNQAVRLGLRYVNHIRIPYPVGDLLDYFRGIPDPPPQWPQAVSSFLYRSTLHDAKTGCAATVMHALADDVNENRIGVIFDIDAYVEGVFGVTDDEIWGTFAQLRDLKNRIFFEGITEAALELFT